jgi:Ca2+-binding RTX toxin-like protein
MHFRKTTLGAVAALAIIPSAALAATINGGPQGEHLRGTNNADTINGNGGNDHIFGRKGDDNLNGGQGNDRIFGASGNDTINGVQGNDWLNGGAGDDKISGDANGTGDLTSFDRIFGGSGNDTLAGGDSRDRIYGGSGNDTSDGQNGNDLMSGGTGDDTQHGGAGNDKIFANLGQDTTYGDAGNDDLWALARGDVAPGPGVDQVGDTLDGGPGNDTFHTRDGEVDRVTCGDGNDTALLDNVDVITDATAENPKGSCETVVRHAPRAKDTASEDAQQSPKDAQKTS